VPPQEVPTYADAILASGEEWNEFVLAYMGTNRRTPRDLAVEFKVLPRQLGEESKSRTMKG